MLSYWLLTYPLFELLASEVVPKKVGGALILSLLFIQSK